MTRVSLVNNGTKQSTTQPPASNYIPGLAWSGTSEDGPHSMESPTRQMFQSVSESISESQPASDFGTVENDWSDIGNVSGDSPEGIKDELSDTICLEPHVSMKWEINETTDKNKPEGKAMYNNEINKTKFQPTRQNFSRLFYGTQDKPRNTLPKWTKKLRKTWDSNTICEKDGLKFKLDFAGNVRQYVCLECSFTCRLWDVFVVHTERMHGAVLHTSARKHLCNQCGQRLVGGRMGVLSSMGPVFQNFERFFFAGVAKLSGEFPNSNNCIDNGPSG